MEGGFRSGELLADLQGKTVWSTVKEINQFGTRVEQNHTGESRGLLSGRYRDTTEVFRKSDGTFELDARCVLGTPESEVALSLGHGSERLSGPSEYFVDGEATFVTQSSKLAWLNSRKGRYELVGDLRSGDFELKTYLL